MKRPRWLFPLVGVLVVSSLVAVAVVWWTGGEEEKPPPVLTYEQDGYLYTYHVLTDTQALFELEKDPERLRNLAPERPEKTRELRQALTKKLGVKDLSDYRAYYKDDIDRLESLGYL